MLIGPGRHDGKESRWRVMERNGWIRSKERLAPICRCQPVSEALRQARFRITGEEERFTGIEDPRASGTTQRYFLLAPINRGVL